MNPHNLSFYREINAALLCKEPLRELFKMIIKSLISSTGWPGFISLKLPDGFNAYCPPAEFNEVWLNVLHIYHCRDYEQVPGFKPERGWRIIDAGAYIGLYTLRASRLVGPEGLVISIEPLDENYKFLKINLRLNQVSNVKTLNLCISGKEGFRDLYVPCNTINSSLVKGYAESMGGISRVKKVKCVTLDRLIDMIGKVDLLKLDVEGAEIEIMRCSKYLTPNNVRKVVTEAHLPNTDEIRELLEERGYRVILYLPEDTFQTFMYAH